MTFRDVVGMAVGNLLRQKGRTLLTLMGVIIGVGALILMVSLGIGLKQQILRSVESQDSLRTLTVTRVQGGESKKKKRIGLFGALGQIQQISAKEIAAMKELEGVAEAYPNLLIAISCEIPLVEPVDGESHLAADFIQVTGMPPSERKRLEGFLLKGRLWKPGEIACVMPSALFKRRFELPLDQLDLGGALKLSFDEDAKEKRPSSELAAIPIVGILDSEKLGLRRSQFHMPLEHALRLWEETKGGFAGMFLYKKGKYPSAIVKTNSPDDVEDVRVRLTNLGYEALATIDILEMINTTFLVVEAFMGCIGAIGLLVALFGIANTMAMSVLERVREIGTMKALGARNRDIRRIFLLEAAWIGLVGGAVGIGGGWLLGVVLNAIAKQVMEMPPDAKLFAVSPWLVFGSLFFSISVSIVAGVFPAMRASKLDPVSALRYE